MLRKALLLAGFAVGLAATGVEAQDGKKPKLDKSKAFEKLDTNADGQLSKEEFKSGFEKIKDLLNEKGGERAKKITEKMDFDKVFDKIDTNKDGTISKSEYEKFEPLAELRKKIDK